MIAPAIKATPSLHLPRRALTIVRQFFIEFLYALSYWDKKVTRPLYAVAICKTQDLLLIHPLRTKNRGFYVCYTY